MTKRVVHVSCIKHKYLDKTEVDLCGLDFIVNQGERIVILGSNGSGKTTLLSHITGLLEPTSGSIEVLNRNPAKNPDLVSQKLGVLFQHVEEQLLGPTVYDDIAFGPRNHGWSKQVIKNKVYEIADVLGIRHLLNKLCHYLSGGEKRKVALAGALVMEPEILVLDEPFVELDPISKKEILQTLNKYNQDKKTAIIVATHQVELVYKLADYVYILNQGEVIDKKTPKEILTNKAIFEKNNLELPHMVQLLYNLKQAGLDIPITFDVDYLSKEIIDQLKLSKKEIT
ncbi:energy-coupling factor ABC transporter ATP-binding protein [Natranaerobius trueperi]|uniref:ABC transporter n=1 Tax=Natranaerobius trueperi TaxID=759412 RepID=A0A226BYS5_9FIRM|nr:ATP-binding cassette domain-containing protein [Natranaerobius trueperi]OWZ84156.1 ABC transporter [Natranaerobius trueperi]